MKHLETFEAAAKYLGYDPPAALPIVNHLPEKHQKAIIASYKLYVISEASWKTAGKVLDLNNWYQERFSPVFNMKSGTGFSFSVVTLHYGIPGIGYLLVCPSSEIAEYVGKKHFELYRDLMLM